jgi:hypothetical protein
MNLLGLFSLFLSKIFDHQSLEGLSGEALDFFSQDFLKVLEEFVV